MIEGTTTLVASVGANLGQLPSRPTFFGSIAISHSPSNEIDEFGVDGGSASSLELLLLRLSGRVDSQFPPKKNRHLLLRYPAHSRLRPLGLESLYDLVALQDFSF